MKHKAARNRTNVSTLGREVLTQAQQCLASCDRCDPLAWMPFRTLLQTILARRLEPADQLSPDAVKCPSCQQPITENTLIDYKVAECATAEKVFEPPLEQNNIVLIDEETVCNAEWFIAGCEHCSPNAQITLDYVLDALTECDPTTTEYVLCRPARCPQCKREVDEKTLVEPPPA